MTEIIRYPTTVLRVEEHKTQKYISGFGKTAHFESVSTGWWVVLDIGLSLPCGEGKPDFAPGNHVRLTLEKVS